MPIAIRFYYDATIAVALAAILAIAIAVVSAVIVGGNAPNKFVAITAFGPTCAILLFRLQRNRRP